MPSADLGTQVWERDKSTCQVCRRKLVETAVKAPYKRVDAVPPDSEDVPIYKWSRECWNCGKETPVVSYTQFLYEDCNIGDIKKLDELLMMKYPFVKRAYSKTMGMEVIANTCIHCGSLQGNWFIFEDLIEMQSIDEDLSSLTDTVLHVTLTGEDLPIDKAKSEEMNEPRVAEVQVAVGHVHHKDGNWENNELDNLVLVCEDCHHKLTAQLSKGAKPQRSRKQAREERRRKKENTCSKRQADMWRANYYTRKGRISKKPRPTDSGQLDDYCAGN